MHALGGILFVNIMKIKYSTRVVIIFSSFVVKIPICRKGFLQGYNERKIWEKYKDSVNIAELKWMILGIVCQKRYAPITEISAIEVETIKEMIPEFNFDNCDFHNAENWGREGDRYILLDYGNDPYVASLY
jgi:hypothetical protein